MGLARFFHDTDDILTKKYDENVLGTADYLAPEQALDSHDVDIRADIYSLGATFYFILTGRPPFAEGTVAQKLIWHQTRQPKSVRLLRPDVPEELAAVLEKMMAKDPAQRYQTPMEVAEVLAPWTQTPIPPPPEAEMPQLSPAAMGGSPGGNAMSRIGAAATRRPARARPGRCPTVRRRRRAPAPRLPRVPAPGRRAVGPGRQPAQERADAGRGPGARGRAPRRPPPAAGVLPPGRSRARRPPSRPRRVRCSRPCRCARRPPRPGRPSPRAPSPRRRRPAGRGGSRLLGQTGFRHGGPRRPAGHRPASPARRSGPRRGRG